MASKKDMQSVIGMLNFVATCVRQGSVFISKLINHMNVLLVKSKYHITNSVKKDLFWWYIQWDFDDGYTRMVTG